MSTILSAAAVAIGLILTVAVVLYALVFAATYVVAAFKRTPVKVQESTTLDALLGTPEHTIYR